MKKIRRLCVSLDGTWNNRDDSTNVLHGHALMFECEDYADGKGNIVTQQRYYQEGVGTGPLDRITGGGFGFGLEEHVRKAYNWLVQNYEDGDGTENQPPDEIYIYGFSRGAYTARSLVGFISMCGLLKRGAPMTVNQLWKNYCILGLELEERSSGVVGQIFGEPKPEFRRITDLVLDSWNIAVKGQIPEGEVPGQKKQNIVPLNPTEKLLIRWSRRVKITYLGVYDTVGAMGWDALSIPGLRSKLAVHHNMRPTTIVQKCHHALAIDEHRSSFKHTPFVAYLGLITDATKNNEISPDAPLGAQVGNSKMTVEDWRKKLNEWEKRIEQRWFVGAHSNIGGGYPDNYLARKPLEWILEGARSQGLICEHLPAVPQVTPVETKPRDSFAEFATTIWATIFRAKRNYRAIKPRPELRANRDEAKKNDPVTPGFSLVSVNETVDESALDYWLDKESKTVPPNLIEGAPRLENVYPARVAELKTLTGKPPQNVWPGEGWWPQLGFVLWATLAAGGVAAVDRLFCARPSPQVQIWLLCILAGIFPLIDWVESATDASLAKRGLKPWRRALLDSIYWIRMLGVVLFVAGLFGTALFLWRKGWCAPSLIEAIKSVGNLVKIGGLVTTCAALGVLLANWFNKSLRENLREKLGGIGSAVPLVILLIPLVIFGAETLSFLVNAALSTSHGTIGASLAEPEKVRIAGLLLLLELAFAYFLRAFVWVGEPMTKANLGSITALQNTYSPAGVKACLERWCKMLGDHHDVRTGECTVSGIIQQALWRDIFGFIPLYSLVMLFGLWFGAKQLGWEQWWAPLSYLWYVVPLVAAVADWLEDVCHLRYLSLHGQAKLQSWPLTLLSFSMTVIKSFAFMIGMLAVSVAILFAIGKIAFSPQQYGWRGLVSLIATTATVCFMAGIWVWGRLYKFLNRSR